MTDQNQFPAPIGEEPKPQQPIQQPPVPQPPYSDWREERRAERAEWQSTATRQGGSNAWLVGLILIGIGVIFLAQNFIPGFYLNNWWALFILIPAFSAFVSAYHNYRNAGRLTASGRGSLTGGLILTFIAAIFLFDLSWGKLWPVFIIIGGLAILFNTLGDRR